MKHEKSQKYYLINLYQTRSRIALVCGILVLGLTGMAIVIGLMETQGTEVFHYFTVLSNITSACGAAFMIPYAVEGIRRKRFSLPRWVVAFQYVGAFGVAITLLSTLCLIIPVEGLKAVQGMNFWLHLITPVLTIVLFQCVETGVAFTWKNTLIVLIPYWCYMAIYFIMVVVLGEENGGWTDFYYTMSFWPVWISALLMFLLGLIVATALRFVQNRRAKQSRDRVARLWMDGIEPTALKIEAFGLGRYMGKHCDKSEMTVPLDIFEMMEERYDISIEELTRAYIKGVSDSLAERKGKKKEKKN